MGEPVNVREKAEPEDMVEQKIGPLQEIEQKIRTLLSEYSVDVSEKNKAYPGNSEVEEKYRTAPIMALLREIDGTYFNHYGKSFQVELWSHLWSKITILDVYNMPIKTLQGYISGQGATENSLKDGVRVAQLMLNIRSIPNVDPAVIEAALANAQLSNEAIRALFGEYNLIAAKLRIFDEELPFVKQLLERFHIPLDENFLVALRRIVEEGMAKVDNNTIRHRNMPHPLEKKEHEIFFAYEDLFTLQEALNKAGLPLNSDIPEGFSFNTHRQIRM